ncbi:MAG: hypothetical protein WBP79_11045 [Candidatus Acidiferrales bacterium]
MASREEEKAMAGLLRRSLARGAGPGGACPEPDALAAYFERSLDPEEIARYELHFSQCARCRDQLAAMVRAEPEAAAKSRWAWAWDWRMLVPVATAMVLFAIIYPRLRAPSLQKGNETPSEVAMSKDAGPPQAAPSVSLVSPRSEAIARYEDRALEKKADAAGARQSGVAKSSRDAERLPPKAAADKIEKNERTKEAAPQSRPQMTPPQATAAGSGVADGVGGGSGAGVAPSNSAASTGAPAPAAPPPPMPQVSGRLSAPSYSARASKDGRGRAQVAAEPIQQQQVEVQSQAQAQGVTETQSQSGALLQRNAATADQARPNKKAKAGELDAASGKTPGKGSNALIIATRSDEILIHTPDPNLVWRIKGGGFVEHSEDAGVTWAARSPETDSILLAGSAPAWRTCWLVGRKGAIFLTTDELHWKKISPPVDADFTSVSAKNGQSAVVVTADGRKFSTEDAGKTWQPVE